ncbi:MAG: polysaccharide biosynthesis tyrosine autokinase, partial [Paludibacter sp.]
IEFINLKEIALKYLKNWRWFMLSAGISLVIAVFYILSSNTMFTVESTVLLRDDNNKELFSELAIIQSFGLESVKKDVEDELHILNSKTLMSNAIRDLDLCTEYYVKSRFKYTDVYPRIPIALKVISFPAEIPQQVLIINVRKQNEGYLLKIKYGEIKETYIVADLSKPFKSIAGVLKLTPTKDFNLNESYQIKSYPVVTLTNIYNKTYSVSTVNKKSNAVKISTVTSNVVKAQAVINKLVELYNLDAVIDKNIIASNTKDFVEKRLELLKNELLDVEISVETYKKQNSMTDLTTQADLFMRTTGEYNKELSKIETQLNLIEYIDKHVKDAENKYSLIPANLGIQDGPLQSLIQSYNDALLQRLKVNRTSNDMNPLISQLEEQISALRGSITTSLASVKDGLKISRRDLKQKESQFSGKIKQIPTQEREYIDIKRQQEIKNNLYIFLLQKREENALTLASSIPSAKTLDKAYVEPMPVSPNKVMIMLIALIIGIIIPIAVLYIIDLFDQTIKNKKELQRLTKVPFVGSISKVKENEKIVVGEGKTTPIAEMFRLIRTNLQFMLSNKPSHVILITSAGSGEGKSFTALNLALSFALTNKKVLLMGLDIRMPMLADYLNIQEKNGITHYLSNDAMTIEEVTIKTNLHKNLHVILSGPVPPNPTELLMSYRLDEMLETLRESYDYIILDSAPLGIVSDTYLLNRLSDNVLFVCRQDYTPREATELINEVYQKGNLNGMGLILNGVDKENAYGYGYNSK